jgi:HK97 family phage portal protein
MGKLKNAIRAFWRTMRNDVTVTQRDRELLEWLGINGDYEETSEATYFTCLRLLSEAIGKMPIKYYQDTPDRGKVRAEADSLTALLSVRPNPVMTPSQFWASVELNCEHHGNSYVWIQRHLERSRIGGQIVYDGLWLMPSNDVSVTMDDAGIFGAKGRLYYSYVDAKTGQTYVYPQDDVLHFKTSFSLDGIMGIPVRDKLGSMIDSSIDSQKTLGNLYKNGLTGPMALEFTGELDKTRTSKLQDRYKEYLEGARDAGNIIPVPEGLKLTPLKMSLTEAQFFELRKHSALQIAAAFGIKPTMLNDSTGTSYANAEAQQLSFLVDTMSFRLKSYEEEINYKCLTDKQIQEGYWYRFNEKALLRVDAKSQMAILSQGVQNGVYTPNEARDALQLPWTEGGDVLMVNGNYVPITSVGAAYGVSQEGGET